MRSGNKGKPPPPPPIWSASVNRSDTDSGSDFNFLDKSAQKIKAIEREASTTKRSDSGVIKKTQKNAASVSKSFSHQASSSPRASSPNTFTVTAAEAFFADKTIISPKDSTKRAAQSKFDKSKRASSKPAASQAFTDDNLSLNKSMLEIKSSITRSLRPQLPDLDDNIGQTKIKDVQRKKSLPFMTQKTLSSSSLSKEKGESYTVAAASQENQEKNLMVREAEIKKKLRSQIERGLRSELEAEIRRKLEKEFSENVMSAVLKETKLIKDNIEEAAQKDINNLRRDIASKDIEMTYKLEQKELEWKHKVQQKDQENLLKLAEQESKLKQAYIKMQAMTDSIQTLTQSIAQMKEINDVSKQALKEMEDKTKLNEATLDTVTKKEAAMVKQMSQMMLIKEAKRLAFRALQKGRAVELLNKACFLSSILADFRRNAFVALAVNVFGEDVKKRFAEEHEEYDMLRQARDSQSRLLAFRREQMYLLSENERLMQEVTKLQAINAANWTAEMRKQHAEGKEAFVTNRKIFQTMDKDAVWHKLSIFCAIARKRHQIMQQSVLFQLQKHVIEESEASAVENIQERFNEIRIDTYKDMSIKLAATQLCCCFKMIRCHAIFSAYIRFALNAKENVLKDKFAENLENTKKKIEENSEAATLFSRHAFLKEVLEGKSMVGAAATRYEDKRFLDLNVPLAHQPHYYSSLPSVKVQHARSVFLPVRQEKFPPPLSFIASTHSDSTMVIGRPITQAGTFGGIAGAYTVAKTDPTRGEIKKILLEREKTTCIPSSPYEDSTMPIATRAAIYRIRDAQQDLQLSLHLPTSKTTNLR